MKSIRFPSAAKKSLVLIFLFVTGIYPTAYAEMIDGIVAVVDDAIIMVSDLEEKMIELGAPLNSKVAERQVLELMVEDIVLKKIYTAMGFPPVEFDEAQRYAKEAGINMEDSTGLIMKSKLMELMVKSRVVITGNMIRDYFDNNEEYTGRESVRLKQILIKNDLEKAQKAYEEIQTGRSFDDVAGEYSEILLSGSADIGWVAIDDLSDEVKGSITKAGTGDILGPVLMNEYYAIFEVMEKAIVGTRQFEDVYNEIAEILEAKYRKEAFDHWLRKVMTEYFIGVYI